MKNIILKYLNDEATEADIEELLSWLEIPKNKIKFNEYLKVNHLLNKELKGFNAEKAYAKKSFIKKEVKVKRLINYKYIAAASIAILLGFSIWFKNTSNITPVKLPIENQIAIGTDKAVLTLEDGKEIVLDKNSNYEGENVESDGEKIIYKNEATDNKTIAYNYLTIPRGGQFHMFLSDGTEVWLNSESKIKYPKAFIKGKTRSVELLYGEAYFDVSPSAQHNGDKFTVLNKNQHIEVLGTEFNIKAYKNENTFTTLVEGKVAIKNDVYKNHLKPGDQSVISDSASKIKIKKVNIAFETGWKNGLFVFHKSTLLNMTKTLSRWYNVSFEFEDDAKKEIVFSGLLKKHDDIRLLFDSLEKTGEVIFEINKNVITVK